MTEFSQADTVQVRAADLVGRVIPGVHGEIASLEAESQRRLQEIREKVDQMSSAELQAAIAELRPPDVRDLVERATRYWPHGKPVIPWQSSCGRPGLMRQRPSAGSTAGGLPTYYGLRCMILD